MDCSNRQSWLGSFLFCWQRICRDKMKDEFSKLKLEVQKLRTENKDQRVMLHKLNELLKQKNNHLSKMRYELNEMKRHRQNTETSKVPERQYKGKFSDRMFHFFSGILG